jgi:hypothetical protein
VKLADQDGPDSESVLLGEGIAVRCGAGRPGSGRPAPRWHLESTSFNGTIIETGTDSYRLASTRAKAGEPAKAG